MMVGTSRYYIEWIAGDCLALVSAPVHYGEWAKTSYAVCNASKKGKVPTRGESRTCERKFEVRMVSRLR